MPAPGGKDFLQAYNCQAVVDSAHQVIVAARATNQTSDKQQAAAMIEETIDNVGAVPREVSADAGYYSAKAVDALYGMGVDPFVAPEQTRHGRVVPPAPRGRIPSSGGAFCPCQPFWAHLYRGMRQVLLRPHQVGEPQQRHEPLRILGQPSIADLAVAEVSFDIQEWVLHLGPDRRFALLRYSVIAPRLQLTPLAGPQRYLPFHVQISDSPASCGLPGTPHRPIPGSPRHAATGVSESRHSHSPVSSTRYAPLPSESPLRYAPSSRSATRYLLRLVHLRVTLIAPILRR